ncbi:hypothetical protein C5167_002308, partial [Papaver somniferum]
MMSCLMINPQLCIQFCSHLTAPRRDSIGPKIFDSQARKASKHLSDRRNINSLVDPALNDQTKTRTTISKSFMKSSRGCSM